MRSLTIALLLAICAPYTIVHCQTDYMSDDGYFFYWIMPRVVSSTSKSEPSSALNSESHSTCSEEPENQDTVKDVFIENPPYDEQSAPVQYEDTKESTFDTKATDIDEEVVSESESSKKSSSIVSSDEQFEQDFINSEFMRRFKWILEHSSTASEVDEQQDKTALNKNRFQGKKYIPLDMKKSPQIEKVENSTESVAKSDSQQISSKKSSEMDSTSEESSYESYEENSSESPEESSSYEDSSSKNTKDDYSENISQVNANPEMSDILSQSSEFSYSDWSSSYEEPFLVPLKSFPDDSDAVPFNDDDFYIIEQSPNETPDEIDDKNISEVTTSTKEEDISSVATSEESAETSTKEESSLEQTNERSSVLNINDDNGENQENFEKSTSTSDDKAVESISTSESIKQDKAESTNQEYNEEIISNNEIERENEVCKKADDDKPLGHLSFGQLIKLFLKRLPLI
jgi:hypothetical protein